LIVAVQRVVFLLYSRQENVEQYYNLTIPLPSRGIPLSSILGCAA